MKNFHILTIATLSWFISPCTQALQTSFEAEDGYVAGESLVGRSQDGATWHGKPELCTVVENEGEEGGQAVQVNPIGDFATIHIEPRVSDLPAKIRFAISVQLTNIVGGSFQVPIRLRAGLDQEAEALRLHFYEGGKIEYFSNGKTHRAKSSDGNEMIVRSGFYYRVVAEMDFEAGTYQLSIGDEEQEVDGSVDIPFMNTAERTKAGRFEITGSHPFTGEVFLDNLEWTDMD